MSSISAIAGGGLAHTSLLTKAHAALPPPIEVAPPPSGAPVPPSVQQPQKAVQGAGEVSRIEPDKPQQIEAAPGVKAVEHLSASGQGTGHFAAAPAEGAAGSNRWFDMLKGMANDMQSQFAAIKDATNAPPPTLDIPGGGEMVEFGQKMLQTQAMTLEFQLSMSAADHVHSTGKAVMDKVTNQQG